MKYFMVLAAMLLTFPGNVFAQSSNSYSASGSQSSAGAVSGSNSYAQGGPSSATVIYAPTTKVPRNTTVTTRGDVKQTYDGDYTVRNVPQVSAPSMGSGHPCGLGGSLGLAIVGGGATGGATRVDKACMLAQMGLRDAALFMYAEQDPAVCRALVATGIASSASYCGGQVAATTLPATPSTKTPALYTKCQRTAENKISIRYTSAGKSNKQVAAAACAAQLGM